MASQNSESASDSGVFTTNESALTQPYPQRSAADGDFRSVIVKIAKQLGAKDRETISYLMSEELGPDREKLTGLGMLMGLEKAGVFHARDTTKLEKLLGPECGRHDLVNKYLKPYLASDDLAQKESPLNGEDQKLF